MTNVIETARQSNPFNPAPAPTPDRKDQQPNDKTPKPPPKARPAA